MQYVDVYKDLQRAGGFRENLATEMEMAHKFGKEYERLNKMMGRMNPEDKPINRLENYYFYVNSVYSLPQDSIRELISVFRKVPRMEYKNPEMFLLGWLYAEEKNLNLIKRIIRETNQTDISDIDVIRYYRLYQLATKL